MAMTDVATAPEEGLVERVQELTARWRSWTTSRRAMVADELAAAIVQLYGEGLSGSSRRSTRRRSRGPRAAPGRGRGRGEPDAHPRPLPRVAWGARARGAGRASGRTWSPTAATSSCSASTTASRGCGSSGSCSGCAASQRHARARRSRTRSQGHAPDLAGIDVEGRRGAATRPAAPSGGARADWVALEGADAIARAAWSSTAVPGLLVANVAGTLLAYRDRCAACGSTLPPSGMLLGGTLTCAACAQPFDLPRAGRCRDDVSLQLEPRAAAARGRGIRVAVAT